MEKTHHVREKRFVRKWAEDNLQDLGTAKLEIPVGEWRLDGKVLGDNTILHLMGYALQTLTDSYAAAKTASEASGAFEAKRDKLYNNTINVRGSGEPVTEYQAVARKQVQAAIMAGAVSGMSKDGFATFDKTKQLEWIDKFILDNDEKVRPIVEEAIAEVKRAAEAKAKLAQAFKF